MPDTSTSPATTPATTAPSADTALGTAAPRGDDDDIVMEPQDDSAPQDGNTPQAQSSPPHSPTRDGADDGQGDTSSARDANEGGNADDGQAQRVSGGNRDDGQGDAAMGDTASNQPPVPVYAVPRVISSRDVDALLLRGLVSQADVSATSALLRPDGSPDWTLPANPEPEGRTHVVGVPATLADIRGGARTVDGYGGPATLLGLQSLTEENARMLQDLYPDFSDSGFLRLRDEPLTRHALDVALDSIEVRRKCASILTHFTRADLARRVFLTAGLFQRVACDLRRLRTQVASGNDSAILDAARAQKECDDLRREWSFNVAYWHESVSNSLAEADKIKAHYQAEIQTLKVRYQDQIDALEDDKSHLKTQLSDAQTQGRILQSRLDSTATDTWTLTSFLQEHASVSGNWDRLHDILTHCIQGSPLPEDWDTIVAVTAVDQRHNPIPNFVEAHQAALASGTAARPSPRKTPVILDLTGPGGVTQTSEDSRSQTLADRGKTQSESKRPTTKKAASRTSVKQHKVQRRPSKRVFGRDNVRKAGEPPSVPKESACESLPGAVVWKHIRPDHRQAMLAGFDYYAALDRIQDDHELHGFFQQPQLLKMLVSMMYWRRLDSTPWTKYVPEAYYEMADERLDRLLSRGEVASPWEAPDAHIAYPDEDAESEADDADADPDFEPPTNVVFSSSSKEEFEENPEIIEPPATKSTSKRPLSSSDDDSEGDVPLQASTRARKLRKSDSGSRRQSSGRQSTGRSQTSSRSRGSQRHRSILACKDYRDLTVQELQMIEVPEDDEISWVYNGVKVQRVSATKASPGQTPGFPAFEPHKHASKQMKDRWDVIIYVELLDEKPWEVMFRRRIRVLYFHRRSNLSSTALRMLERIVDAMLKYARELWERGHWVTIDKEADSQSAREYTDRASRRNTALREYNAVLDRAFQTQGFPKTMRYEPGIWKCPARCCPWIWQDPRVEELGGPACDSLGKQLAAVDEGEPARIQWGGGGEEAQWLKYVPTYLQTSERMLSKDERRRNPISLKDMRKTLSL